MRRIGILIISAAILSSNMFASSVLWNGHVVKYQEKTEIVWQNFPDDTGIPIEFYVNIIISAITDNGRTVIHPAGHVLAWSIAFAKMESGSVVREDTTFFADSIFYLWGSRPGDSDGSFYERTDYDIDIASDGSESVYLGFGTDALNYATMPFAPMYVYGWIEIAADGTTLQVLDGAIDISGSSMRVGAIPEPSATALLLFGFAILATRRKRYVTTFSRSACQLAREREPGRAGWRGADRDSCFKLSELSSNRTSNRGVWREDPPLIRPRLPEPRHEILQVSRLSLTPRGGDKYNGIVLLSTRGMRLCPRY